ncbi:MAG TPA: hypothetical protein VFO77_13305 [Actinoplanes sp.]|nr:hypothetical protein [Actinoplanes sp.]
MTQPAETVAPAVADAGDAAADPRLPPNIATVMAGFGQYSFDPSAPQHAGVDPWESYLAALWPFARDDPDGFAAALAEQTLTQGGWAVYGAAHAVVELTDQVGAGPAHRSLLDASLAFLRDNAVPMSRLTGYEKDHWNGRRGAFESWLAPRTPPDEQFALLTPLRPGEVRRVVQLEDRPDANHYTVQLGADGRHTVAVNARWSDDDPRRVRSVWHAEDTLHDLYTEIGWTLQVPPYWHDGELRPYIPFARPGL